MTNIGKFFQEKHFNIDEPRPIVPTNNDTNLDKLITLRQELYEWLTITDSILSKAGLNMPAAPMGYEPVRNLSDREIEAKRLLRKVRKGILQLTWKKQRKY